MDHIGVLRSHITGRKPFIVGIGGTTKKHSTSENALRECFRAVEAQGIETRIFCADELELPMYRYDPGNRSGAVAELVSAFRRCTGLVISSPAYHGSIPGMIKNALDYIEDLNGDARPYLDGRAVGCIVSASGVQALGTTLVSLRMIIHSLRGWPTPYGAVINSETAPFDKDGTCRDDSVRRQLAIVAKQVSEFVSV